LLLITWVISLLSFSGTLLSVGLTSRLPTFFLLRSFGLLLLWIVLIGCVWKRQGWARIGILLLLIWGVANLLMRMQHVVAGSAIVIPVVLDVMRAYAVFVLFKPESNAWFGRGV